MGISNQRPVPDLDIDLIFILFFEYRIKNIKFEIEMLNLKSYYNTNIIFGLPQLTIIFKKL